MSDLRTLLLAVLALVACREPKASLDSGAVPTDPHLDTAVVTESGTDTIPWFDSYFHTPPTTPTFDSGTTTTDPETSSEWHCGDCPPQDHCAYCIGGPGDSGVVTGDWYCLTDGSTC